MQQLIVAQIQFSHILALLDVSLCTGSFGVKEAHQIAQEASSGHHKA